jgi:hypothetical protein
LHIAVTDPQSDIEQDLALSIDDFDVNNKSTATQLFTTNESIENEDDDGDLVAGPTVEAHVTLAKTSCKFVDYDMA